MSEVHLFDPQTLYRHREEEQWSPFAIDLGAGLAPKHGNPAAAGFPSCG
jgi:hypothetical protein